MIEKGAVDLRVSIITVCYNSADHIEWTIRSVLEQTYANMEYIIVDGGSQDGTTGIIRKYEPRFDGSLRWISERDEGIFDAMNKGIRLAGGDIIALINSDDFYCCPEAVEKMAAVFGADSSIEGCFCDVALVDRSNPQIIRRLWIEPACRSFARLEYGWLPAHPALFVKKEVYEKYGLFDTGYCIASDSELMYRFIGKYGIKTAYLPEILIKMRVAGVSNNSIRSIIKANSECFKAMRRNNIFPYLFFLKPLRKVGQLIRAKFNRQIPDLPFTAGTPEQQTGEDNGAGSCFTARLYQGTGDRQR